MERPVRRWDFRPHQLARGNGGISTMAVAARGKSDSTYCRLKELVLNYRFRPGEPLSAVSIADRLQVSATPVREALARLHGEDLVELLPNRGFFAKTLNANSMKNHYEFAFQIVNYAIQQGRVQFLAQDNIEGPTGVGSRGKTGRWQELDSSMIEHLYIRIVGLSGNRVMVDAIRKFNDQTRLLRLIDLENERNYHEITADMSALISALQRQDVAGAIANLRCQRDKKLARMNELVHEGIARSLISLS
ncbi:GntR family transcriptional regulator [Mesorhizobium australicum]|uniref:GntR family transcriptional regulator n=1 Tax=Mesorhizobium australicum TaxID=536018 RepID=UPI00333D8F66